MPAYMIARTTVTDKGKFEQEFMPAVQKLFQDYNVKLLVQSDAPETVKGDNTSLIGNVQHLAILEFTDLAAARACAASSDFQAAMAIADTCMTDHYVRLVDGLAAPKSAEPVAEKAAEIA